MEEFRPFVSFRGLERRIRGNLYAAMRLTAAESGHP